MKNGSHLFIDDGYYENLRGQALKSIDQSKSYVVDIPDRGTVVRNCKFLKLCIENRAEHFVKISTEQNDNVENNKDEASGYATCSGRVSKLPHCLDYNKF